MFVGNLPFNVDSFDLAALLERAGNVEMVEVIYDKLTGRSRGFGFVTMSSVQEVEAAEQQFNDYERLQRSLMVCQDKFETAKLQQIRTEAMTGLESCVDQSIQESISTLPPLVEISNIDVIQDLMLAKMKKSL